MTDDFTLFADAADRGADVSADIALITAYLARELSLVQIVAVEERLATDAEFRELARPIIRGWIVPAPLGGGLHAASATPTRRSTLTRAEIDAGWQRYQGAAGDARVAPVLVETERRPAAAPARTRRPWLRIAAAIAVILLPMVTVAQVVVYAAGHEGALGHAFARRLLAPFTRAPSAPSAPNTPASGAPAGASPSAVPLHSEHDTVPRPAAGSTGDFQIGRELVRARSSASASQPGATLRPVVEATIGGKEDAPPEYSFGEVSGLAVDATGRIFVADADEQVIRVYSPAGTHLFNIGRDGAGPGEFRAPRAIAFGPDHRLWVRDEGNGRFEAFTVGERSATYSGVIAMQQVTMNSHSPIVFDKTGNLIEIGYLASAAQIAGRTTRSFLDAAGKVVRVDTLYGSPADSIGTRTVAMHLNRPDGNTTNMTRYVTQPFGPQALQAFGPNGQVAMAVGSRYVISLWSATNVRMALIQRTVPPVPVSNAERTSGQASLEATLKSIRSLGATPDVSFSVPAIKPPIRDLRFGSDGSLWVTRSVAEGKPREIDVFDAAGKFSGTLEVPLNMTPSYHAVLGLRSAVTTVTDSLDVTRVVRLRFR